MPKMTVATFVVLAATAIASIYALMPRGDLRPEGFKEWAVHITVPPLSHTILLIAAIIAGPSKTARRFVLLASFLIGSAGAAILAVYDGRDPTPIFETIICQGLAALALWLLSGVKLSKRSPVPCFAAVARV